MKVILVHSIPRSGSTIFCRLLEEKKGYLVLPETYFHLAILSNKFKVTEKSIQSCCPDGFPIKSNVLLDYLKNSPNKFDSFLDLIKEEYEPEFLVIKSTRLLSYYNCINSEYDIKYIWIDRNPINIFESMQRVSFGVKNRDKLRFSIWYNSYCQLELLNQSDVILYENIPSYIKLMTEGNIKYEGLSSKYHAKKSWHKNLMNDFLPKEKEKREELKFSDRSLLSIYLNILLKFPFGFSRLRRYYDDQLISKKINHGLI